MVGPTAAGKSAVALRLAEAVGGVILSVDSMQVYRGMDIGTAKPTRDECERVPHHMIDLVDPSEDYSVAEFQVEARRRIDESEGPVVIAGGSGLHFRAVVDPLEFPPTDAALRRELEAAGPGVLREELLDADPGAGDHVDLDNPRRLVRAVEIQRLTGLTPSERAASESALRVARYEPALSFTAVGFDPGGRIQERVSQRLEDMRRQGLVDEVRGLEGRMGRTASQAVGYKELLPVVRGEIDEDEGFTRAEAATLELVRTQRSYFGRDPRIRWIPWDDDLDRLTEGASEALEI